MTTRAKTTKTTLLLDADLHLAARMAALQRGTTLKDIVAEALKQWLEDRENEADAAAMDEVAADERIPWEQAKAEIAAAAAEKQSSKRGR